MSKERLDIMLVNRGLAESRSLAQKLIMAGDVLVNEQVVYKPSQALDASVDIKFKQKPRYVSRGGLKLEKALQEFNLINLTGKICVDVGASTGGFTDCLLQHYAEKVFAVDVGYGQIHQSLRNSSKVVVMEKTNVREIQSFQEKVDFVTIDVSFISLKTVLPIIKSWVTNNDIQVIALVKPQFEAGRKEAARGKGVIRSEETRLAILDDLIAYVKSIGINYMGYTESPILGPKGNKEFLLYLVIPAKQ
ncbi:MAG: TlyA family RNA methyltransferase [Pelolinea sp.]|nr:TlyA family RNA methyltransferase [Pelolinea sp.]